MPTSRLRISIVIISILLLGAMGLSACNFPGFVGSESQETPDAETVKTQIAATLAAQDTLTAQPGALPTIPAFTSTASPTLAILTPGVPTTEAPPPPPGQPIIRADIDTNCRVGPSTLYPVIGYLLVGQESVVHGKNSDETWWYISTPEKPGTFCWAWGSSTRVEGDTSLLPVITPPPPPTLTPTAGDISINATFSNIHLCGGVPTAIFGITNTGSVTIESVSLVIEDLDTNAVVYSTSSNSPFFPAPNGCPPGASALAPGDTAYVGGAIGPIPANTNMRLTAQLCSGEDLSGDCLTFIIDWGIP